MGGDSKCATTCLLNPRKKKKKKKKKEWERNIFYTIN